MSEYEVGQVIGWDFPNIGVITEVNGDQVVIRWDGGYEGLYHRDDVNDCGHVLDPTDPRVVELRAHRE